MVVLVLILIVGLVLLVLNRKDHTVPLDVTRKKYQSSASNYFDFQGLSCHYTDEGKGETILLIHGLGDSFKMYDRIVPSLKNSYRVVRLDLPGFGLSDVPKDFAGHGSPVEYYRAFMNEFVQLAQISDFHLMGNSLGGLVSWEYALKNEEKLKSLTLISSAGYDMEDVKQNITKGVLHLIPKILLKRGMPLNMAKQNVAMVIKQRKYRTKEFIETHYDMINAKGTLGYMIGLLSTETNPDTSLLKSLDVPTFIAWGENDKITPAYHAERFNADISNSTMKIYSNCGHYPQVEHTEEFLRDWTNFYLNCRS